MIIRKIDDVKTVEWGNGLSRRFLLESDGLGYSVTDTLVRAGTSSNLRYERHLEACYCISGRGYVVTQDGVKHEITPGTLYALDEHDAHELAAAEEDMRLVCVFTPALRGDETHDLSGGGYSRY